MGFVGAAPKVRPVGEDGAAVTTFPLATSENMRSRTGEWTTRTEWHNIVVYNDKLQVSAAIDSHSLTHPHSLTFIFTRCRNYLKGL